MASFLRCASTGADGVDSMIKIMSNISGIAFPFPFYLKIVIAGLIFTEPDQLFC
jgi:hypothetical protein